MLDHLCLAFPNSDRHWRYRVARDCARHLGCLAGEVLWLWGAPPEELLARTTFRGLEHLDECIRDGHGAIIGTGHCGNWEWLNLGLAARGTPLTVVVRALDDPRLDSVVRALRGRFGGASIGRGEEAGRRLVSACRAGAVVGLLIDQDIDAPGSFVEFFGTPAWTPTGAGLLARRLKRPIVPSFAVRQPSGDMLLTFDPPMDPVLSNDAVWDAKVLTARLTARIERQIRAYPEQWVWMHRRWRRSPAADEEVLWQSAIIPAYRQTGSGTPDPPASVPGR